MVFASPKYPLDCPSGSFAQLDDGQCLATAGHDIGHRHVAMIGDASTSCDFRSSHHISVSPSH